MANPYVQQEAFFLLHKVGTLTTCKLNRKDLQFMTRHYQAN